MSAVKPPHGGTGWDHSKFRDIDLQRLIVTCLASHADKPETVNKRMNVTYLLICQEQLTSFQPFRTYEQTVSG